MRSTWKRRATAIALGTAMTVSSIFTGGITNTFSSLAKASENRKEIAKFDFGIDDSLTAEGWKSITVNGKGMTGAIDSLYSMDKGYGLSKEVEGRTEDKIQANDAYPDIPSEVYTDFAIVKGSEFLVDIPNGEYEVEMIVGTVNSNKTYVNIEGIERSEMNPGKVAFNVWTENVSVKDGQMNFEFPNTGDGRINGIRIYEVTKNEESTEGTTEQNTEESTEGSTGDNSEETTPVGNVHKFDFNIKGSQTGEGWKGVTVNAKGEKTETGYIYTPDKGYGFIDTNQAIEGRNENIGNNEGYNIPSEVYSDYAIAKDREFVVDLENGVYAIQFIVGSVNSNTTKIKVEDMEEESINPGKVTYGVLTLTGVEVLDGQLNMTFSGDARINAILISTVDAPKNLQATINYDTPSVSLTWSQTNDIVSYNIYRKDNNTNITRKLDNVTALEYVDTDVDLSDDYTYYVTGISVHGVESAASNEVSAVILDANKQAPKAPENVKVIEVTDNTTTISWDPVEGATLYRIYWSDRNRKDLEGIDGYAFLNTTKETTFTYEKSTHMQRYFKVIASNAGGDSNPSEAVSAKIKKQYNAQVEYLNRGLIAVKTDDGVYVGWRLRGDEYTNSTYFELYRDGKCIATVGSNENTNYLDTEGTIDSVYSVKAITNGYRYKACNPVSVWANQYMEVPLDIPEPIYDEKLKETYYYNANDTNIGDADGDGEYELYVKWDPSNSQDNSKAGFTGPTIIDCYKLDGTRLFRINLGINVRSGAHYTQFQVYDFDGDGKSEIICKTADGTTDGVGNVIGDATADYRHSTGYVLEGPEFLTLFDGYTGEALDTIPYNPARGNVGDWGDTYGNRVDRFLAGVAYLDGKHPSAIFSRGYYTRAVVCAYDVIDKKLSERFVIDSNDSENKYLYAQGAHSLSAADVDNDGFQEVIFGSATIDHDGTLLYSLSENGQGYGGHGDAERIGDFNLRNPGLEIFMVHEEKPLHAGVEMHNGSDGSYIFAFPTTIDTGRGAIADIDPRYEGAEAWSTNSETGTKHPMIISQDGEIIGTKMPVANYTVYWDGDLGKEIVDHKFINDENGYQPISAYISKWDWEAEEEVTLIESSEVASNNGTKGNPSIQADIFGDWREEVAWRLADNTAIRIYTTVDYSDFRLYTLMHDIQYRAQVSCEVTGYNQSPTQSFYIGFDEELIQVPVPSIKMVNASGKDEVEGVVTPPTEEDTEEATENITSSPTEESQGSATSTTESGLDDTNGPSTGDHTPFALILTIMLCAFISGTIMYSYRKKED